VVATGWNLTGTLSATFQGFQIGWANGTTWTMPRLDGSWTYNGRVTQVVQVGGGTKLMFVNEFGIPVVGYVQDSTHVVATGWGNLVGTLSATFDGFRIDWANGTAWDFLRLGGSWSINGQATQVAQPNNGNTLTFTNEFGDMSAGYIQDSGDVVATGWGNLVGTLVATADGGVQINWANGTAWKKPQLAGL
jgi:hypothetical protein